MTRCYNPKTKKYERYGGRGIKVCKRWHTFKNFYADMGDRPSGKTLDRIDNGKGYNKKNCRWATQSEQCHNRHYDRRIIIDGVSLTRKQWTKKIKISVETIKRRVAKDKTVQQVLKDHIDKNEIRL